jgi:plastocyanin
MNRAEILHRRYVRPVRLLAALIAVPAVLGVITACGSGSSGGGATPSATPGTPTGSAAAGGGSTVDVKNFMFTPKTLTVSSGTTVTWKFDDSTQHTVAANDNSFSSSAFANGQTFTHTFASAATVAYHCSIHPFMTGTITVK